MKGRRHPAVFLTCSNLYNPCLMRYASFMTINVPLSPHLQAFVRKQLASGRFQSEDDLIRAALLMLEENSRSHETSNACPHGADQVPSDVEARSPSRLRSPRGILADIRSSITSDDIKSARQEMWSRFPNREA
jgi:putative addiction module CopG family antidote